MWNIGFNTAVIDTPAAMQMPTWLTVGRDPRPKCTLIIGNGFTLDFLKATGLDSKIHCHTDELFPHITAKYLPTIGDKFSDNVFWDKNKWPKLFEYFEDTKHTGWDFFRTFPIQKLNPHLEAGVWTFDQNSLAFELRSYLWHLFRYFHHTYLGSLPLQKLGQWKWRFLLHLISSEFSVRIINFNYDLILEKLLVDGIGLGREYSVQLVTGVEGHILRNLEYARAGSMLLMKPHGSIGNYVNFPFGANSANPWLVGNNHYFNSVQGHSTSIQNFDINRFPIVPDIVPPGHFGDDICNPESRVHEYCKHLLSQSDLVVSCGLSGAYPDDDEVKTLLASIPKSAKAYQVGLPGDEKNTVVGQSLSECGCESYKFVNAEDLFELAEIINDSFDLYWKWKD